MLWKLLHNSVHRRSKVSKYLFMYWNRRKYKNTACAGRNTFLQVCTKTSPNRPQLSGTPSPKFALKLVVVATNTFLKFSVKLVKLVQTDRRCHKYLSQVCTKTSQNWSQLPQTCFSNFAVKLVQTSQSCQFAFVFLPQIVNLLRNLPHQTHLWNLFTFRWASTCWVTLKSLL